MQTRLLLALMLCTPVFVAQARPAECDDREYRASVKDSVCTPVRNDVGSQRVDPEPPPTPFREPPQDALGDWPSGEPLESPWRQREEVAMWRARQDSTISQSEIALREAQPRSEAQG